MCDALSYVLPPFELVSRRVVQIGLRLWELWSPNSGSVEFYPGVTAPYFSIDEDNEPRLRRADGH